MDNTRKGFKLTSTNKDKRIAELEKVCQDLSDKFDYQVKQVMKLEKENAELNNFITQSKKDGISPINALIIKNLVNHLTNAKEIIKLLLWDLRNRSYEPVKDLERAEQFLNENSTYERI